VPAVADPGAETTKWVAGAADTLTELDVPVIEEVTVSVAVMGLIAARVQRGRERPRWPLVRVESPAITAAPSLLVK